MNSNSPILGPNVPKYSEVENCSVSELLPTLAAPSISTLYGNGKDGDSGPKPRLHGPFSVAPQERIVICVIDDGVNSR